ncbi:MAG: 4Fe-4S binding protein [Rubripirellula sp.]|nr:4Fe-4S binding protein [Rubripirellula sp.]
MSHVDWQPLLITSMVLLATIFFILVISRSDRRSKATLRLDWFLPAMLRQTTTEPGNSRPIGRLFRRLVPNSWLSNHRTKQRGEIRRSLRRLGVSWLASPPRRILQSVCLLLFLVSFFYTCWPYTAAPRAAGDRSPSWTFAEIDSDTGNLSFRGGEAVHWFTEMPMLYMHQDALGAGGLPVAWSGWEDDVALFEPLRELTDSEIDSLFTSSDDWIVSQDAPNAWPSHYADDLRRKEWLAADLFLAIDPLVSLSTGIASRSWVWSLVCAAMILIVCVLVPRGFCGYICPLGTTIDLFDWAIAGRTKRLQVPDDGWWVHIKYYLLGDTLVAALFGVLISGFFSAIPVITRAMLFLGEPLQSGMLRGWHLVPAFHTGQLISILMFVGILCLGFLRSRFWCKYVCPSGAVFSLGNIFRLTERKVESSCIHCNKCIEICPFDAIKPDFTTRTTDCTLCQSCGGVCPTHAIKFVERWNIVELKLKNEPQSGETAIGRRGFLSLAAGGATAVTGGVVASGAVRVWGAGLDDENAVRPVRPPGSVPEQQFLQMCIRCGECFKACPNNVLQPEAFEQGVEGLWTPMVQADWAGCESSCNACGQVCPTGAIRALPLEEKRVARMGLAIINETTCLPFAGQEDCDLCVQECKAAGYRAIEYVQVGTQTDEFGAPIAGTGRLAPAIVDHLCVGCGLCQTRCYGINVKEKQLLIQSAVVVEAGPGKEDRLLSGSYVALRRKEHNERANRRKLPVLDSQPDSTLPTQAVPLESDLPVDVDIDGDNDGEIGGDDNPFGL